MTLALTSAPLICCQDSFKFDAICLGSVIQQKLDKYVTFVKHVANLNSVEQFEQDFMNALQINGLDGIENEC